MLQAIQPDDRRLIFIEKASVEDASENAHQDEFMLSVGRLPARAVCHNFEVAKPPTKICPHVDPCQFCSAERLEIALPLISN